MTEVSKKKSSKGKVTKIVHESTKEIKMDRALIDNFIALQRVMLNLSTKFDNLSAQIGKLLDIFEISAKSLARRDFEPDRENRDIKLVIEKLNNLSQQSGLIGKGLALIHEANSERRNYREEKPIGIKTTPIQAPAKINPQIQPQKNGAQNYQRSITPGMGEPSEIKTKKTPE